MSNGQCHLPYLGGVSTHSAAPVEEHPPIEMRLGEVIEFPGCLPAKQFLATSVFAIYNAPILAFG